MFDRDYCHYLSYGATDQQTVRDLAGSFDGLLVPGTVAAFQREGTGGFVLALSASSSRTEYVIDPRFPLFQQALPRPKRSHLDLAAALLHPELVRNVDPQPADFDSATIDDIARGWATFNRGYRDSAGGKFDKYARRLREEVTPADRLGPRYVLPPYTCVSAPTDPWWVVSNEMFERTAFHVGGDIPCIRVVAAKSARALSEVLPAVGDSQVVVWVSGLDELTTAAPILAQYLSALGAAANRGVRTFALYGGFFGVVASSAGLRGSSHGIGYGESRNWVELPQSGPPPARYYLPQVHRYVSQELAYQLWVEDRRLAECDCAECQGQPPIALDYHSLMRHSVLCRAREIGDWVGRDGSDMAEALDNELTVFRSRLHRVDLPAFVATSGERSAAHMSNWVQALREVAEE